MCKLYVLLHFYLLVRIILSSDSQSLLPALYTQATILTVPMEPLVLHIDLGLATIKCCIPSNPLSQQLGGVTGRDHSLR